MQFPFSLRTFLFAGFDLLTFNTIPLSLEVHWIRRCLRFYYLQQLIPPHTTSYICLSLLIPSDFRRRRTERSCDSDFEGLLYAICVVV